MYRKGTTVRNHLSQDQTTEEACQCSFKGRAHQEDHRIPLTCDDTPLFCLFSFAFPPDVQPVEQGMLEDSLIPEKLPLY